MNHLNRSGLCFRSGLCLQRGLRLQRGFLLALLTFFFALSASAQNPALNGYDRLLKKYVNANGLVNYDGLATERAALDAYTAYLAEISPKDYERWNDKEKMAMWINAYNAYTLVSILDATPIKRTSFAHPKNSIRQIKGVWKEKQWPVMGSGITLDDMEHKRLRRDWKEPRIHMAIVCASIGCPSLRPEAFRGAILETQLAEQTRAFFADRQHFGVDTKRKQLNLSKLFEWFGEDFGDVATFAAPYVDAPTAAFLKAGDYKTAYLKYDWTLNAQ